MELLTQRSDMVITGGVDCLNDIFMHMCFAKTGVLSHSGDARPFSAQDDGTVLGEGIGILVLKRLVDAERDGETLAYPDTVVGTDSHTTMINGIGVLGWGVGGIEAEAAMLGQAITMLIPQVVGFKLTGRLPEGATATDLVLTIVEMLRKLGVVGKFVEFYGDGLAHLPLADRATIANMAPEYGATCGIFPVDDETLNYLRLSGRSEEGLEPIVEFPGFSFILGDMHPHVLALPFVLESRKPRDDEGVNMNTIRDALNEGRDCTVEILNRRKDGSLMRIQFASSPVLDSQGKVTGVLYFRPLPSA